MNERRRVRGLDRPGIRNTTPVPLAPPYPANGSKRRSCHRSPGVRKTANRIGRNETVVCLACLETVAGTRQDWLGRTNGRRFEDWTVRGGAAFLAPAVRLAGIAANPALAVWMLNDADRPTVRTDPPQRQASGAGCRGNAGGSDGEARDHNDAGTKPDQRNSRIKAMITPTIRMARA
jgi:hypothetical protein